jgi:hypothetical protein
MHEWLYAKVGGLAADWPAAVIVMVVLVPEVVVVVVVMVVVKCVSVCVCVCVGGWVGVGGGGGTHLSKRKCWICCSRFYRPYLAPRLQEFGEHAAVSSAVQTVSCV